MSMAINRAKYTGDPGLWDVFKGAAKFGLGLASEIPIFGGGAKIASRYLFPPAPGTTTYAQPFIGTEIPRSPTGMPGSGQCAPGRPAAIRSAMNAAQARGDMREAAAFQRELTACGPELPGPMMLAARNGGGPMEGFEATTAMLAGKPTGWPGFHWNKSGYFLKSGEYVPPGTKAVRNRRRNPANPRATSNAIMRITGAKRYAKSLGRISIRKKKC